MPTRQPAAAFAGLPQRGRTGRIAHRAARLGEHQRRPDRALAAPHDRRDLADAALRGAHGDALGRRRRDDLQRCLFRVCRRAPSGLARFERARGLARGGRLQRPCDAGGPGRWHAQLSRPGADAAPRRRRRRAGLDEPRLLAAARRRRRSGRRDGDRRRDQREGARRTAAAERSRAVRAAVRAGAELHGPAARTRASHRARQPGIPATRRRSPAARAVDRRSAARGGGARLCRAARSCLHERRSLLGDEREVPRAVGLGRGVARALRRLRVPADSRRVGRSHRHLRRRRRRHRPGRLRACACARAKRGCVP